jgi:hypothetical protein
MCTVGQLIKGLYVRTSPNFCLLIQALLSSCPNLVPFNLSPYSLSFLSFPPFKTIRPQWLIYILQLAPFIAIFSIISSFFPSFSQLHFPHSPSYCISIFFCTFFTLHYTGSNGKILKSYLKKEKRKDLFFYHIFNWQLCILRPSPPLEGRFETCCEVRNSLQIKMCIQIEPSPTGSRW